MLQYFFFFCLLIFFGPPLLFMGPLGGRASRCGHAGDAGRRRSLRFGVSAPATRNGPRSPRRGARRGASSHIIVIICPPDRAPPPPGTASAGGARPGCRLITRGARTHTDTHTDTATPHTHAATLSVYFALRGAVSAFASACRTQGRHPCKAPARRSARVAYPGPCRR